MQVRRHDAYGRAAASGQPVPEGDRTRIEWGPPGGARPSVGRPATPAEIAAWDIDVRPDFKGLPPGSGSVAEGQKVWDAKCASCHGTFGESNEVFTPLVGGTTTQDVKTGRVAALTKPDVARTT